MSIYQKNSSKLQPMTFGFDQVDNTFIFFLVEWASNLLRNQLVTL